MTDSPAPIMNVEIAVTQTQRKATESTGKRMNQTIYVYIAGPYTQGDVVQNVRNAIYAADRLANWPGEPQFAVYVPHLTHLYHMIMPHGYEWWLDYDLDWLEKCDCLWRIPGASNGADSEVEYAKKRGIPVFYSDKDVFGWAVEESRTNEATR